MSASEPSVHVVLSHVRNITEHMQVSFLIFTGRHTAADNDLRRSGGPVEILPFAPGASKTYEYLER